ncbi:hypothetical protein J6590_016670 [Homalodisca vitripennis]|nr:hypothetical protein J6590_016670 [Homalodisca vitripennis]
MSPTDSFSSTIKIPTERRVQLKSVTTETTQNEVIKSVFLVATVPTGRRETTAEQRTPSEARNNVIASSRGTWRLQVFRHRTGQKEAEECRRPGGEWPTPTPPPPPDHRPREADGNQIGSDLEPGSDPSDAIRRERLEIKPEVSDFNGWGSWGNGTGSVQNPGD